MTREVVVIGAGIVGVCLADALSRERDIQVTVLDQAPDAPAGSTTFAPGFVGLYNDAPVLTELAKASASTYDSVGTSFRRSGGLEIATSTDAAAVIEARVEAARAAGLPARMRSAAWLPDSVTSFVDPSQIVALGDFPADGSADVVPVVRALRQRATERGARFCADRRVTDIDNERGRVVVHTASGERVPTDAVVLAVGVWGPALADRTGLRLPLFPVAHPYVYDKPRAHWRAGPFVRWPEHHVYARVHNDRLGIGSYDHRPVSVTQQHLRDGAGLAWSPDLDPVIATAGHLLCPEARFIPEHRVNGVFAMTPDNLPFLGRHPGLENVWVAQALWVTHAAGAAQRLVDAFVADEALPAELRVSRFDGLDNSGLRDRALRLYRDIYASDHEPA
ncbi:NAD(P)/FAD-dependent oxidoreductase [Flexivirga meconopsidis]|uniref:NAD(P)/FAD-dependent oxidoreductase n=1 Tax=Flexivirga meconopsidis TaxID=2977121 RepID=UPI002240708C